MAKTLKKPHRKSRILPRRTKDLKVRVPLNTPLGSPKSAQAFVEDDNELAMPQWIDFQPNEARQLGQTGVFISRRGDDEDLFFSGGDPRKRLGSHKGRYPLLLSVKLLKRLLRIRVTDKELCSVMGITIQTLARLKQSSYFVNFYEGCRAGATASLRRQQWRAAMGSKTVLERTETKDTNGNTIVTERLTQGYAPSVRMLVHLGKVYLHQSKLSKVQAVEDDFDIFKIRAIREKSSQRGQEAAQNPTLSGRVH